MVGVEARARAEELAHGRGNGLKAVENRRDNGRTQRLGEVLRSEFQPQNGDRAGSIGLADQVVFPEINIDKVAKIRGLNVTVVTTAKTDEEALELLRLLKFPFRKN